MPIYCQVTVCFCADSVKFPWHCFTSIHFKKRRENYSPPSKQNPYHRAISHRSWNLRMLPKCYLRFHWDCKQPLGWTEEQYVKLWNLFPTFLWNYTYNFENIFDTIVLHSVGGNYCKRYDAKFFVQVFRVGFLDAFNGKLHKLEKQYHEIYTRFIQIRANQFKFIVKNFTFRQKLFITIFV